MPLTTCPWGQALVSSQESAQDFHFDNAITGFVGKFIVQSSKVRKYGMICSLLLRRSLMCDAVPASAKVVDWTVDKKH